MEYYDEGRQKQIRYESNKQCNQPLDGRDATFALELRSQLEQFPLQVGDFLVLKGTGEIQSSGDVAKPNNIEILNNTRTCPVHADII